MIDLTLRAHGKGALERLIVNEEVDIAVLNDPPQSPELVMEPLRREKLVAFTLPSHPLARRRSLTISDFRHVPLVIRGERSGGKSATEEILREIENQGVAVKIAMRCESPEAVKAAVREKMGLGLLFEGLVRHDAKRGDFKTLKIKGLNLFSQSCIVYKRDKPLSSHAQAFLALLRQSRRESVV